MTGEGVDKQLKRDDDGVNPRDSLPGPSADNSNDVSFRIALDMQCRWNSSVSIVTRLLAG